MESDAERVTFEDDLFKVMKEMTKFETEQFKFLCLKYIPFKTIDQMNITDLLQSLEEKKVISADKYNFLIECLILIGRMDIAHQLGGDTFDVLTSNLQKYKSSAGLDSFFILLHTLAAKMEKKEVQQIIEHFIKKAYIPREKLKTCHNGFQLMSLLLKVRHIHANNLKTLFDLVQVLNRKDLEEKIKLYQDSKEENKEPDFECDNKITGNGGKPFKGRSLGMSLTNAGQPPPEPGKPFIDRSVNTPLTDTKQPKISSQPKPEIKLEKYKMTAIPRGICLIFNNVHFMTDKDRTGSDVDKDELVKVFTNFHFKIIECTDLTKTEMQNKLDEVGSMDHGEYDCFVCCILSHGHEGYVVGVDGISLAYKRIQSPFTPSKCKSLTGKPKLFFIQACQGSTPQSGEEDIEFDSTVPTEADFLMAHATVAGYVSIRDPKKGSWFIQNLCSVFNEHSKNYDLTDMLLMVNDCVCKEEGYKNQQLIKQIPAPINMLRKKVFFL